ncbi:MAG: PD40 domain-containing protein [Anaerolineae bacterium]|nr:PD40 domain-containing protein [Anaerolineae bacterium]
MRLLKRVFFASWLIVFALAGTVHAQDGETGDISWHPDGTYIAVSHEAQVEIVNAATIEVVQSFPAAEHGLAYARWSPDGNRIAFFNEQVLEIWRVSDNPFAATLESITHPDSILLNAISWHPSDEFLAFGAGSYMNFSDSAGNRLDITFDETVNLSLPREPKWDSTGERLAIPRRDGEVEIWQLEDQQLTRLYHLYQDAYLDSHGYWENPTTRTVDWSPEDDAIAFGTKRDISIVLLRNLASDQLYVDTSSDDSVEHFEVATEDYNRVSVLTVDWHPTLNLIASGLQDGTVRIWYVETGEQIHIINLGEGVSVMSVAWSPDGTRLAYGLPTGSENLIEIIELADILQTP